MKLFERDDVLSNLVITLQQYNDTLKKMLRVQREVNRILKDENHRLKAELNVKTSSDNNKCDWEEFNNTDAQKTGCGIVTYPPDRLWKYCPFCGKEIVRHE